MNVKLQSLDDVLMAELSDLMSAEKQLIEALPKVAGAASSKELREAIEHHLDETRGHVQRLEKVFESLGTEVESEHCEAMEGLIGEGEEIVEADGSDDAKDAALIGAAQRVEHYEIAAYGTARTLAEQLGKDDAAALLQETLDEESAADQTLTKIAVSRVNEKAAT
jgi:ferritin-like metal-binding protein YciE